MIKKLFPISCLFVFLTLLMPSSVLSQSPSPQASPTDEDVQGIREAVKEKVQEKLEEATKRAFVGEILEISNGTLKLKTRQEERQIKIDQEVKVINIERKETEISDLEIGGFVIAMGYLEDSGILDTRRVVMIEKPQDLPQTVAFGEVTDKSAEENVLTVKHPKKGTVWSVEVVKKTEIEKKEKDELEEIDFDEIEVGDRIIAIGETDTKENFITARIIQVFPLSPTEEE